MAENAETERGGLIGRIAKAWRSTGSAQNVAGDVVEVRAASVGEITARRAALSRSVAREIRAEQDVTMALSAAARVHAGGDAIITGGAAGALLAGGDARMEGGSAAILVSRQSHLESGMVGLLIARDVQLSGESRVLLTLREALIIGAAIGTLVPLVRYLLNRFVPAPAEREAPERPWYVRAGLWAGWLVLRLGVTVLTGWLLYRSLRRRVERLLPFLEKSGR